jgi:hypothetical protein
MIGRHDACAHALLPKVTQTYTYRELAILGKFDAWCTSMALFIPFTGNGNKPVSSIPVILYIYMTGQDGNPMMFCMARQV